MGLKKQKKLNINETEKKGTLQDIYMEKLKNVAREERNQEKNKI